MSKHSGRLELTWTDKEKTLLSTGDGKYDYTFVDPSDHRVSEVRLLHEVGRVEAEDGRPEGSALPAPTTDNLLITGDAMHVLDAISKIPEYAAKYLGKLRCVYIDPPFNTEQTFSNYEDSLEHSIWLTMLRDRLRQIKPLLAANGSVWVHLDDSEVHRCRAVMDEELGPENFVAEVIWEKADSPNNSARYLSKDTDTILVYARNKKAWRPNRLPRNAAIDATYTNPDNDPRGRWYPGDPYAGKPYSLGLYEITGPTGRTFRPPKGKFWRISEEKFRELEADDRIYWGPDGNARPSIKRYLNEVVGLTPRTLWRHADVGSNRTSKNEIRNLFPDEESFATPKPERLIQRVLQIATDPGDIVLDCFAGSGSTAAVAHKMGRKWITSELLAETAERFTKPRLTRVIHGEDLKGISSVTVRVEAEGTVLPDETTPEEAQLFNKLLNKFAEGLTLDAETLKTLRSATKTKDESTRLWYGGGGFTHLKVGPSMFETVEGFVCLADWATKGELAKAMCAQLEVRYSPDGIFAAKKGGVRFVVLDGLVGETTVESILEQLADDQIVEIWATQYVESAADLLRKARPGSRLEAIPDSVLDRYRRKAAKGSPFAKKESKSE